MGTVLVVYMLLNCGDDSCYIRITAAIRKKNYNQQHTGSFRRYFKPIRNSPQMLLSDVYQNFQELVTSFAIHPYSVLLSRSVLQVHQQIDYLGCFRPCAIASRGKPVPWQAFIISAAFILLTAPGISGYVCKTESR